MWPFYENASDLFVSKEFNRCVREDSEESGGMTAKETGDPVAVVDVAHGGYGAEMRRSIFGEGRGAGLE